jgi:hypothetical protein
MQYDEGISYLVHPETPYIRATAQVSTDRIPLYWALEEKIGHWAQDHNDYKLFILPAIAHDPSKDNDYPFYEYYYS